MTIFIKLSFVLCQSYYSGDIHNVTFVQIFPQLRNFSISRRMDIFIWHAFCYYYITFWQFLFVDIVTSEQNKGIVLYSQRSYKLESGTFTGIPLPLFLILICIHHSGAKSEAHIILNSFWKIYAISSAASEQVC